MQLSGHAIVDYFSAFSENEPCHSYIQGVVLQPVYFLRKKDVLVVPEIEIDMMDNTSISIMIAQSCLVFDEFPFCKSIYLFGLANDQITTFNKSMRNYKLIESLCEYPHWICSSDLRRKIRKAMKTFRFSCHASHDQILEGVQLARYADYYYEDAASDAKRSAYYYQVENAVRVLAWMDDIIVGCMLGARFHHNIYMLEHNYDPEYVRCYLNDGLYYSFLNQANDKGITHRLGMTAKSDAGLLRMKAKYSTATIEKNVLIIDRH